MTGALLIDLIPTRDCPAFTMKKQLTFALALLAFFCTRVAAQTIDLSAAWSVGNDFGGSAQCTLTLTNIGTSTITTTLYEFDYGRTITPGAPMKLVSQVGNHWTMTNQSYYSGVMLPGGTKSFPIKVVPGNVGMDAPTNIFVNGLPLVGFYVPPALSMTDAVVTEGDAGTASVAITFTLSRAVDSPASFNYAATAGSAISGEDFLPAAAVVTFPPGQTQQTVTVNVIGDRKPEYDETFTLALSNLSNCTTARTSVGVSIFDDDRLAPTFYSAWHNVHNVPLATGDLADDDSDGFPTISEYAFELNPNAPDAGETLMEIKHANGNLQLTYAAWRPDVAYRVQASENLSNWTANGVSEVSDGQMRTASVAAPAGVKTRFLRLSTDWLPNTSRFMELYQEIHDPANGYFSPEGIPYHSPETLLCEAPDYGHETTSEAYSYYLLLEAMYGRVSGDWSRFAAAWANMETYMIPTHDDQPTSGSVNAAKPASYAPEWELPSLYPAQLNTNAAVGADPLFNELKTAYGTSDIYGMHWLLDVDNWYGFGRRGDGTSRPSYINTFQRGAQESVWETVPQPSWENFNWGGPNGYLDLFTGDSSYKEQWRYTNAPDADARAVQAVYWAKKWADAQGGSATVDALVAKAARMGDTLRYSLFDKYFRNINNTAVAGTGRQAAHYLLSWYYAWGGSVSTTGAWSWRIGSSHSHFGYQNPVAAWVLGTDAAFIPKSPTAQQDWVTSTRRQLEFYRWLQSHEGAIAGGATSSWNGRYETPPVGTPKFYNLAYTPHPVYADPPSNEWFGFQAWSMQRVAELYYLNNDALAKQVLDKWVVWVLANVSLANNSYSIPVTLGWSGQPDNWNATTPGANAGLHVTVTAVNQDVGISSSLARTLLYYAAGTKRWATENTVARETARTLLDRIWTNCRDEKGLSIPEKRADYRRFFEQQVYTPPGWSGQMPNGDTVMNGVSFINLRSKYRQDPAFPALLSAYENWVAGGRVGEFQSPTYRYHRFWAQVDAALANAEYDLLFPRE